VTPINEIYLKQFIICCTYLTIANYGAVNVENEQVCWRTQFLAEKADAQTLPAHFYNYL
jgi:hypothetical protein